MTGRAYLAACVLLVAACETDRTTVFEPVGPPVFDFGLATNSSAALPSGTAAVGATSVTLTMASLRAVGGSYQFRSVRRDSLNMDVTTAAHGTILEFFLRDSTDAGGMVVTDPITGDPIQVTDTNEVSLTRTATYAGTDDEAVFAVEVVVDSTSDGSNPAAANAVVVSLEGGAVAPGSAMFLWRRIGVAGGGSMSFGNFGGTDVVSATSPNDYIYPISGGGQGGIRGNEVALAIEELSRPPIGFFYRGFLVDPNGNATLVDTLRSEWSADSALSRVSLFNVDENSLLPGLSGMNIAEAQIRNCVSGSNVYGCANTISVSPSNADKPFGDFLNVVVVLDPKGAPDALGGAVVITGEVPDESRN